MNPRIFLSLAFLWLFSASPVHAAYTATATIANGGSLSSSADLVSYVQLGGGSPVAIIMPAAWTAADITFQGSVDGGTTFNNIYTQGGTEYKITSPAASEYIIIPPDDLVGINAIKIRSGTSGVPVNQGAARNILVVIK
jgi:hypothetical protein